MEVQRSGLFQTRAKPKQSLAVPPIRNQGWLAPVMLLPKQLSELNLETSATLGLLSDSQFLCGIAAYPTFEH
jgi:hypothetical protein